jgi:hypothetical protein
LLTRNDRQEGLCRAYVHAIAARCGMSTSTARPDYGIDLSLHDILIRGNRRVQSGYKLDIQAKRTFQAKRGARHVRCDLDVKSYDDLRLAEPGCPHILVVLVLPKKEKEWSAQTENELLVRHCAYWLSLKEWPATRNRRKVRLLIPRANVFSVKGLRAIMKRVKRGEDP